MAYTLIKAMPISEETLVILSMIYVEKVYFHVLIKEYHVHVVIFPSESEVLRRDL